MEEESDEERLKGILDHLRSSVRRGEWFEISDSSAGVLLRYIGRLEDIEEAFNGFAR